MAKEVDLAGISGKVHNLLKSLSADERQRVVTAVMTLFGDPAAVKTPGAGAGGGGGGGASNVVKFSQSLASYLTAQQAHGNQNKRFLVTADWLRQKGVTPLSSGSVAKALKDYHQPRLGNPSDCLNQNVAKGLAEKDGKNFFITPDGLKELGHSE